MSTFLIYFETKKADANWSGFNRGLERATETFEKCDSDGSSLFLFEKKLLIGDKKYVTYIISNLISSDQLLISDKKNKDAQKEIKIVYNFLMQRAILSIFVQNFLFYQFSDMITDLSQVSPVGQKIFSIDSLNAIGHFKVEANILYTIKN